MDADWIKEIRGALADAVPEPPREASELDACGAGRIIGRKRNWSAPGPDGITNFWAEESTGIVLCFLTRANTHLGEYGLMQGEQSGEKENIEVELLIIYLSIKWFVRTH